MRRFVAATVVLAACAGGGGGGQQLSVAPADVAAACQAQKDGRVFSQFFNNRADFGRVLLCNGYRYRASASASGVTFDVRTLTPGAQEPLAIPIVRGQPGALGMGTVTDFDARNDGVFEIRVQNVDPTAGTTLNIDRTGTFERNRQGENPSSN
jgi:hypothetical protein